MPPTFGQITWRFNPILLIMSCQLLLAQPGTPVTYAAPGRLVDIGGRRLHLNCRGEGSPTVVLESGAGDFSLVWGLVQPRVAAFTRVCSYDRAGYAWSEAGPQPRRLAQIALELHTGLVNDGIKAPYVLVGASLGGLVARVFTNQYPNEIAGMVLVDSAHEDAIMMLNNKAVRFRKMSQGRTVPPAQQHLPAGEPSKSEPLMAVQEVKPFPPSDPRHKLGELEQRMWAAAQNQKKYEEARQGEFQYLPEELGQLYQQTAQHPQPLGDKPLIVLTRDAAGYPRAPEGMTVEEVNADRKRLQGELAHLSLNSKLVVVKDTAHEIHLDQPAVVAGAIREVVEAARAGRRLGSAATHLGGK